jgi:zinc/manganese transport system substrate-binding protein
VAVAAIVVGAAGCSGNATPATNGPGIRIVAAENEYGDVAAQVGGRYVTVISVEHNPNLDPHTYEVSPSVARAVAAAQVVIQNGLGYDGFMNRLEASAAAPGRRVIDVQRLLGLPDSTGNPHLWYSPTTMPAVANALADDLAAIDPAHAGYFRTGAARFVTSLQPWLRALAALRGMHTAAVATTEPVADYLLQAAGVVNRTPFRFQADLMNGVDPSPQGIAFERSLLSGHQVGALVYNQQVTDSVTRGFIADARAAGVPVVGVYETMPEPGFDYQSWMLAETRALQAALIDHKSTERL